MKDSSLHNSKVSVIIVCFNQEKTIGRAIESVLAQKTDFLFELIIGEDCSTDGTLRICREYENRFPDKVKVRANKENKGVLNNYYDCVLAASGEYISDLGGDDFWIDEHKLQIEADTLDKFPDVSLVHTDWKYYNEETGVFSSPWGGNAYPYLDRFATEYPPYLLLKHISPIVVHLCSAMYRKDLFLKIYEEDEYLFRNKEFLVEDLQLTVMLATEGRFIFINRETLAYSVNNDSMTGNRDFRKQFDLYLASLKLTRYLEKKIEMPHNEVNDVYKNFSHFLAMQAFHAYDADRMKKLKKSIKDWDTHLSFKTSLILFLGGNKFLWKPMRSLWKTYRKLHSRKHPETKNQQEKFEK